MRPAELGIASSITRRRTPGLRREEVAARSRLSTEYYTQLEQARGANPSRDTLDGLAIALRLSRAERNHLYHLAGESPPPDRQIPTAPPESLLVLLDRMVDTAVLVIDAKQDLIAWNALAGLLLDECVEMEARYRNLARRFFLHPDPRARHFGMSLSKGYALYLAAELRTAAAKYPQDAGLTALIAELREQSAYFERLWQSGDVLTPRHLQKKVTHPTAGLLYIRCDTLLVEERDQRVVLFTAKPRTRTARVLRAMAASIHPGPARNAEARDQCCRVGAHAVVRPPTTSRLIAWPAIFWEPREPPQRCSNSQVRGNFV